MLRCSRALLVVSLALVLAAAPAAANIYGRVLATYEALGSVPPCKFTSQQLQAALREESPYDAQYFQDFTTAIRQALSQRASGACLPHHPTTAGAAAGGRGSLPSGSLTSGTAADLPAPILLMALVGLTIALAVGVVLMARWRGWEPSWAQAWRHSWREAEYRGSGAWAEFLDWLRSKD